MRVRHVAAMFTAALAALAGCAATPPQQHDNAGKRLNGWFVLDADAHGAIVVGGSSRTLRGIDRSGRVMWEKPNAEAMATCEGRCPALRDTAQIAGALVWQPTSDDAAALAMVPRQDGVEVQRFVRGPSGWEPGEKWSAANEFGCTAGDRPAVIIATPRPVLLSDAARAPIPELTAGSECAFNRDGAVIALNGISDGRTTARVVAVTGDGTKLWTAEFGAEARVRADAGGDAVAVVSGGTATTYALAGKVLTKETGVDDARFDETGALVLVDHDGVVRWVTSSR
ncbi:hypothetical protein [Lentzea flava]|uniref:PQQ-like domain-containing protein n=1 Tax=Lentzea flava TaxID=103732 RepID=A0ABQ2V1A3_9PSEU|nr:hypothetical protein [Lentzea flava]MCP2202910.1 hypothetical protein [Lentzea flava]GGU63050.1 hypothetical protein GCM10010178_63990 [Lentzea flava]